MPLKKIAPDKITVFYAWQDSVSRKTNRYAIRDALNEASAELSGEHDIEIHIDEATRGAVGSVNIPATILAKIQAADIFVCDITTVNGNEPNKTFRMPNPNVTFELGYAVAYLGWERVVMLFNEALGT